jgi:hypothetical protein
MRCVCVCGLSQIFNKGYSPKDAEEEKRSGGKPREELGGWVTDCHPHMHEFLDPECLVVGLWLTSCASAACVRLRAGTVLYASNVLGSRGPRKMQVCIPRVDADNNSVAEWWDGSKCVGPVTMICWLAHDKEAHVSGDYH